MIPFFFKAPSKGTKSVGRGTSQEKLIKERTCKLPIYLQSINRCNASRTF